MHSPSKNVLRSGLFFLLIFTGSVGFSQDDDQKPFKVTIAITTQTDLRYELFDILASELGKIADVEVVDFAEESYGILVTAIAVESNGAPDEYALSTTFIREKDIERFFLYNYVEVLRAEGLAQYAEYIVADFDSLVLGMDR